MQVFFELLLCFFALVGALYLLRDAHRLTSVRRLDRAHFLLLAHRDLVKDRREYERAMRALSSFLTRPEAAHLIESVYVTDAAPQELAALYGAAEELSIPFDTLTSEELLRRI